MIVCSCNAIREDDIRKAARRGARCAEAAYRALGHEPQCGSCLSFADEIVAFERGDLVRIRSKAA